MTEAYRVLCFLMVSACLSPMVLAGGPPTISGRVVDRATRHPVPRAHVTVRETGLALSANSEGYFELNNVPPGRYSIQVTVLGYAPEIKELVLREGEEKVLAFELREIVYELNPVTVTSTRERSLVSDVPSSVDVVSLHELERGNVQNISQAVEAVPGVYAKDYGGLGDLKTISIRGSSSSQVLILVDGQRFNSTQSGDVDLGTIPIEGAEQIEVVRGGASALYGADAMGGVINIITKSKPYRASVGGSARLLAGSFGTRGFEGGHTYSSERFFSVISYKYLASNGNFTYNTSHGQVTSRTNADLKSHSLFTKGTMIFGEETLPKSLSLSAQYSLSKGGVPGSIDYPSLLARRKNLNGSFNLVYEQRIATPYNNIRVQSYYCNSEYVFDDPGYPDQYSYNHNVAWGAELQGRMALSNWNAANLGYAYRGDRVSSTSYERKKNRGLHSIYVQDEFSLVHSTGGLNRRVVAIPALRWDRFSDFLGQVSPKVGVVVSVGEAWQASIKANYGRTFRAPSFNDLYWKDEWSQGNSQLKPERGRDFDVGVMFRHPSFLGIGVDVTYFSNSVDDLILWQTDVNYFSTPQNVGRTSIHGLETRVSVSMWDDVFGVGWNSTYLDARNKTEGAGQFDKQLPYRPTYVHNFSARVEFFGMYVLARTSFSGKRYTNAENTHSLDPHRISGIVIGYGLPSEPSWLAVKLEINNLENVDYQVIDGYPMPGRELRFSLGVQFSHDTDVN